MTPKHLHIWFLFLLFAPLLGAETADSSNSANWQFAQAGKVTVPKRSKTTVVRPQGVTPTNHPAAVITPAAANPPVPGASITAGVVKPVAVVTTNSLGQIVVAPTNALSATNLVSGLAKASEPPTLDYNFVGIPLDQLLDLYSKLVGRTLLRASQGASAIPGTMLITLKTQSRLTTNEAIAAFETVMGMNGITVIPIGEKFAKVVVEGGAGSAGGVIANSDSSQLPDSGKFVTQIVQLKYALAADIVPALQPFSKMSQASIIAIPSTQILILRDYVENVKRMLEMVEKIDIVSTMEIKPEVIAIKYALASEIASALGSLGGGTGTSVGKSSSGGLRSSGASSGMGANGAAGGYQGQQPGMNQPGMNAGQTGGMSGVGTAGRTSFQNNLQKIIHAAAGAGDFQLLGQTKIIADERTNSLLVFANDQDMQMIKDIIAKLDVVLAQVLIEAIILEVSLGDSRDVGISYLQKPKKVGSIEGVGGLNNLSSGVASLFGGGTNASSTAFGSSLGSLPGGFSYFAKLNNDLDVVLTAVAGDSRVNVLSRPRIQTSHNQEAVLFVGETVPYVTGTYFGGGINGGPSSQYQSREVGISLNVLPLINPEGLVVMDIAQNIEQLGKSVTIPGAGDVPSTTKRNASSKVAVRDRETIILGGFISNTKSKSNSGIPFLKDIPGLGVLFRSNSQHNDRVELIVLIRPTVLRTPEIASAFATTERENMSGVKQAELDLREDERLRNEKIEVQLRKEAAQKAKKAKSAAGKAPKAEFIDQNLAPDTK
jgi:general secretion pathway protein D